MSKNEVTRMWDRLPKETDKAWEAFQIYRDMGPKRSQRAVGRVLSKSSSLMKRWSQKYNWPDRAHAFDAYHSATLRNATLSVTKRTIRKRRKKYLEIAKAMQHIARVRLAQIIEVVETGESPGKYDKITPRDAVYLALEGINLERHLIGDTSATEPQGVNEDTAAAEQRLKKLKQDPEFIRELDRIAASAGGTSVNTSRASGVPESGPVETDGLPTADK